MKKNDN